MPMTPLQYALVVDTIAVLGTIDGQEGQVMLTLGALATGDGLGGFYRWTPGSTQKVDGSPTYNYVASATNAAGQWVRQFQRVRQLGPNLLVQNGSFKSLYCPGVTDATGRVTCYLTSDGTATGTAVFTQLIQTYGEGTQIVQSPQGVLIGARYSLSADLRTLGYQFSSGATTTLGQTLASLLNLVIPGLRAASVGQSVVVRIDGL